jgi:hypothetical protein
MKPDHRIREAEARLFARSGLQPEESFLGLRSAKVQLRGGAGCSRYGTPRRGRDGSPRW